MPWIRRMRRSALLAVPSFALYLSAGMAAAILLGLATFGLLFVSFLSGLGGGLKPKSLFSIDVTIS